MSIFQNDRARGKIIKLMKQMTAYFLKYNSPKTFYEHPIVQTSALPISAQAAAAALSNNMQMQQPGANQHSARGATGAGQPAGYQPGGSNIGERAAPGSHSMLAFATGAHH